MEYEYKRLSSEDVALIRQLLAVFGRSFEDFDTYQGSVPSDAYLTSLLEKAHFIAIVALDGETVVGGLAAYELEKFEQARSEIYIYDLAVAVEHRRRGVATGLIRVLQREAKRRGAYVIFVQADPPDTPALALYESLGVRESVFHFDIPVDISP